MMRSASFCFLLLIQGAFSSGIAGQSSELCVGNYWTEEQAAEKMLEFSSRWDDQASWEARAEVIRQGLITGMKLDQMPEIEGNFNPIIHSRQEMEGYTVENIALESFPGFYVTGNLYRPVDAPAKMPAVIATHGHKSNRGATENLQKRCASLARMGALVFSINMVGMPDPVQVKHKMPIALLLQTWNSIRVLDYLCSREDVDTSRIGMTGESGGGTQTFILAALDKRIKVSVPVVQGSAHFFGGCVGESGMPIHKSDHHQTNNVEIAALCAPRPQLLISDGEDWTRNTPEVEYPYLRKVYALYGAEDQVQNVHLTDEGHDYGFSKRLAAYEFIGKHLGLDQSQIPESEDDESFVHLLGKEELEVFNDSYPLSEKALRGDKAVMDYLGINN